MADKGLQDAAGKLKDLIRKTNTEKPKSSDVKALRQFLSEHGEMWRMTGDLVRQAQYGIIETVVASPSLKESLKAGMRELSIEMSRPGDGPLERLLIDQVVTAWLRQGVAEYQYTEKLKGEIELATAKYLEYRLTQTQARYLKACQALARVRKLSRPGAVQVNIAERQTNIAQGASSRRRRTAVKPAVKEIGAGGAAERESADE